ncbi:MAG: SGNH/GDSL hydrolase family protein [Verrucomicrobiaceae bacterium]
MHRLPHLLALALALHLPSSAAERSLVTDEPVFAKGRPEGAAEYVAKAEASDGRHLALTMQKLQQGMERPFLIWAIGSSYTNMLGSGEFWQRELPKRFPKTTQVEYRKMVGNSCPWQYLRGWARHLVIPDQPDLVITYTIGNPADLEKLLIELRRHTTADIIVPSIHWRERDIPLWGKSENAADQDVAAVREVCRKYDVEFIENRRDWAAYLTANKLPVPALLKDAVHQSDYGAHIINSNILAHFRAPESFSYAPESRERLLQPEKQADGSFTATFTGTRIDLHGTLSADGGTLRVLIDEKPAREANAWLMSYVQPDAKNAKEGKGANPRDQSPHGITLGKGIVPQTWTLIMTSDSGDYELTGSVTGPDGRGNAFQPFTSTSGQILIEPDLWRRAERNRTGDRFTFDIKPAVVDEVIFTGTTATPFVLRLAQMLPNAEHKLRLVPLKLGAATINTLQVFQPPGK